MSIKDRAAGAVMGAFIGDALGVGPHWYYDLDEMRRDYGDWITGYTDPEAASLSRRTQKRGRFCKLGSPRRYLLQPS